MYRSSIQGTDACDTKIHVCDLLVTNIFATEKYDRSSILSHWCGLVENLREIFSPLLLEPVDGLLLRDTLTLPHLALTKLALADTVASALHANVEVHAVDARVRVVLEPQIDVLADAKPPVARVREVAPDRATEISMTNPERDEPSPARTPLSINRSGKF
jgi:hypothetical protein